MYFEKMELKDLDSIHLAQDVDQWQTAVGQIMGLQFPKRKKCLVVPDNSFHQQTGLKFKEETSKMLHLEHSFVWC
jgi:hypothetical protein